MQVINLGDQQGNRINHLHHFAYTGIGRTCQLSQTHNRGWAKHIGQHRQLRIKQINNRLNRAGYFMDFIQNRFHKIGKETTEIKVDVGKQEVRGTQFESAATGCKAQILR